MTPGKTDPEISNLVDDITDNISFLSRRDQQVLHQMSRGTTDPEVVNLLRQIKNNTQGSGGGGGTVVDTGTFIAEGGEFPAFDGVIDGVISDETSTLRVDVSVSQEPSWDLPYGYNIEWGREWDNTNLQVDVAITVVWDIDPGDGNDLDLRYTITSV